MGQGEIRAGDSDRQRVADQLKAALDEGRLDLGEYDERLQRTYAARTYADLDGLLTDLPGTVPVKHSQIEKHAPEAPAVAGAGPESPGRPFLSAVTAFLVCTLVWLLISLSAGDLGYFWPGWVLIPVLITGVQHLANRRR